VYLVTGDESLWPLVGADLSGDLILRQLDSIEELLATVPSGQAGIVLWDARTHADAASAIASLALHSTRFALVVLDSHSNAGVWTLPLHQRQIVANVGLPLSSVMLGKALERAREEANARMALLGDSSSAPEAGAGSAEAAKKTRWLSAASTAAIAAAIMVAAAAAFVLTHHGVTTARPTQAASPVTSENGVPVAEDKVDGLIERAQQAMLDRHFIDPAAGSALALYRDVLRIDPDNGEARQGLERLAEILVARVQSALDERKFDTALKSLETAQQLIDEAAEAKLLPPAKLAQLREDVRKRRDEFDAERPLQQAAADAAPSAAEKSITP
jgi:hypothetical protein